MGRKILGWFGGILVFLVVLGVAMTPLEEQPDEPYASSVMASTTSASVTSPEPDEEPQTVVLPSAPIPSPETELVTSPEPAVSPTTEPVPSPEPTAAITLEQADYVLNTNSEKFHYPTCSSVSLMSEKNKRFFVGTRDEAIEQGFDPCQNCNP